MKKALIVIGSIIALILVVAAFLPSESHVERSININAPVDLVFDQVNDLQKNFNWSPWLGKDPDMKLEWGEATSGEGASYSWSGNSDVGEGSLTIAKSIENEFIQNNIDFGEMGKGEGTWKFETIYYEDDNGELNEGVHVIWALDSRDLGWPMGRIFGLMMDGMVGADFEEGLGNLKDVSESLPVEPKIEINEINREEMYLLTIKDSSSIDAIGESMGAMYGELIAFVEEKGIEITSYPVCIYHEWNTEGNYAIYVAALPVSNEAQIEGDDNIQLKIIPAHKAGKVVHMGPYDNLNRDHYALGEWITSNGHQMAGAPYEVYVSDPSTEPDSSKWITEIYYPIQ